MIYILFFSFLVLFIFDRIYIKRVDKHDDVLFPFCELRRDIMQFLYQNVVEKPGTLSREDYRSVRQLSNALDVAIHNYNEHKTLLFNLRKLAKYLQQYRHTLKRTRAPELTENRKIQEFHARFVRCLAKAFMAYTPLIRSELTLRLVVFAYRSASKRQYVFECAKQVRGAAQDSNVSVAMA